MTEATVSARRLGILALISPVMTSVEGRCVAMTMCMPAARAVCARRTTESSTSLEAAIIRSAISSMPIKICGIGRMDSSLRAFSLYSDRSRTLLAANS